MKLFTALVLATPLLAFSACDDKPKEDAKADAKADDKKPDDKKADPAADKKEEGKAEEEKPADGGDAQAPAAEGGGLAKLGVEACDRYIEEFTKCIDAHGPAATKSQVLEAVHKTHEQWTDLLAGPGKDMLEESCKASIEGAKISTKEWGCTWSE